MQVDPIKPTFKAPGTKRLNPKYDILLQSFAFKFNLRRYSKEDKVKSKKAKVRRCRLTL